MEKEIGEYVETYEVCQKDKPRRGKTQPPLKPLETPTRPWGHITMEFCYNGYANWDDRRCRSWIYLTAVLYTTFTSQHTIGLTQHAIDIARSVLHLRTRSTIRGCALNADGHSSKPAWHLTKLLWMLED